MSGPRGTGHPLARLGADDDRRPAGVVQPHADAEGFHEAECGLETHVWPLPAFDLARQSHTHPASPGDLGLAESELTAHGAEHLGDLTGAHDTSN